jgi:hypothetical protein
LATDQVNAMTDKGELLEVLLDGTTLVAELVEGKVSVEDFLRTYGNFYYYNALDGHEATPEQRGVLEDYAEVCRLHERVQGIVDLVYAGDEPNPQYEAAGRILGDEAARRIVSLAEEVGVSSLLSTLRAQAGRSAE